MNLALIDQDSEITLSSLDFLTSYINPARVAAGESAVENGRFIKKVEDELDDLVAPTIVRRFGNDVRVYNLTMDQMMLVGMRESKAVRRIVLDRLKELSRPKHFAVPTTLTEALKLAYEKSAELDEAKKELVIKEEVIEKVTEVNEAHIAGRTVSDLAEMLSTQYGFKVSNQQVNGWLYYKDYISIDYGYKTLKYRPTAKARGYCSYRKGHSLCWVPHTVELFPVAGNSFLQDMREAQREYL